MKIETDIIASIATSPIVRVVILMIRYVRTFKTNVIVFVGKFMFDVTLTDNSNIKNIKSQFVATINIICWDQRKNVKIPDNKK
jgi:hypothetical protein